MSGRRKWSEIRAGIDDPECRARVDEEKRVMGAVMTLFEMREQRGASQEDLARVWATSQPNVSKIERQDDLFVSTVQRYVEALGGRLEMHAVFPDQTVRLHVGATESAANRDQVYASPHKQVAHGSADEPITERKTAVT